MRRVLRRLPLRARGRGLRRARAVERGAGVGARGRAPRRRRSVRGRVHGRSARAGRPAGARAPARRLVVGKRAPERARLERARAAGRPARGGAVVVTGPARAGGFDLRVPAQADAVRLARAGEPVLLQLPLGRAPPQGAILELDARLKLPRPASTASTSAPGSGATASTWSPRQATGASSAAGAGSAATRTASAAWLARSLAPGLTGERRAVLEGIVLGEDEDLSPGLQDAFRASGLYHLLAVSGSNVMFVALGVLGLAWVLGLPRWLGHLGALAGIASYVLAVGAQPSVIRAGIAGALGSLAWLAARRSRPVALPARWGAAAAGLEPVHAARRRLPALVRRGRGDLPRRPADAALPRGLPGAKKLADVVAISFACGVVTAPILVLQFGRIPLYSVPANALAAPVVAPLLALSSRPRSRTRFRLRRRR